MESLAQMQKRTFRELLNYRLKSLKCVQSFGSGSFSDILLASYDVRLVMFIWQCSTCVVHLEIANEKLLFSK